MLFLTHAVLHTGLLPIIPIFPADAASGIAGLQAQLNTILKSVLGLIQGLAPVVGGMGLAAIGLLYVGSSIPPIAEWKNQNRGAVSSIMIGLIILMSVSVIVSIIPTS